MPKFNIEITETLQRTVEIEAASLDDALIRAQDNYNDEEIILDSSDFVDVDFKAEKVEG